MSRILSAKWLAPVPHSQPSLVLVGLPVLCDAVWFTRVWTPSATPLLSLSTSVAPVLVHSVGSRLWPSDFVAGFSLPPWPSSSSLQIAQAAAGFTSGRCWAWGLCAAWSSPSVWSRLSASSSPFTLGARLIFWSCHLLLPDPQVPPC